MIVLHTCILHGRRSSGYNNHPYLTFCYHTPQKDFHWKILDMKNKILYPPPLIRLYIPIYMAYTNRRGIYMRWCQGGMGKENITSLHTSYIWFICILHVLCTRNMYIVYAYVKIDVYKFLVEKKKKRHLSNKWKIGFSTVKWRISLPYSWKDNAK